MSEKTELDLLLAKLPRREATGIEVLFGVPVHRIKDYMDAGATLEEAVREAGGPPFDAGEVVRLMASISIPVAKPPLDTPPGGG